MASNTRMRGGNLPADMKERLLKRLRRWNSEEQLDITDLAANELAESISADIEMLLNTRRGTVLIDPDMGLPDLTRFVNGYSQPDVDDLQHDIQQLVRRFEPRLRSIDVRYVGDQGKTRQLAFSLSAEMLLLKQRQPFTVRIVMNENGSTSVTL